MSLTASTTKSAMPTLVSVPGTLLMPARNSGRRARSAPSPSFYSLALGILAACEEGVPAQL
jgi:hypothetical protein